MTVDSSLILWLLVWLGPVLAFSANNIVWFDFRQVAGSVALSACLGILCGIGTAPWPEAASACVAGLVFCILSERLITLFAPKIPAKLLIFLAVSAVFGLLAHFFGLWPLCALLLVHAVFSVIDLNRNRRKPKHVMPLSQRSGEKEIPVTGENGEAIPQMARRPNIYILFLESIHSRKALQEIYGIDDAGLAEFLLARNFTVFSRSCSNEYGTTLSLNTLLNMSSEGWKPLLDAPPAFRWVKSSGYEINFIDCALYTFAHYVPWCDYFNFSMPRWVAMLYAWFLPFFLQSSPLTGLTRGIDPFTDRSDFTEARNSLLRRMERHIQKPAFYLVRFGATHVPSHYTWREKDEWREKYIELYRKTVPCIREIVADIFERDPDGCIVVMGDHGAASWQYAWQGKNDCNANMRNNGVEPAAVAQDLTGILLAIRLPGDEAVPDQPITPSNILRIIFEYNGAPRDVLPAAPTNFSYLHEPSNPDAFIIAKDADGLQDWEIDTPAARLARKMRSGEDIRVSSVSECLDVAESLEASGMFRECAAILERGIGSLPPSAKLALKLATLYARMGMAFKCPSVLEKYIDSDEAALGMFAKALALTGHARQALKMLDAHPLSKKISSRELLRLRAGIFSLDGQHEEAAACYGECVKMSSGAIGDLIADTSALALCLDCQGRTEDGLAELDRLCLDSGLRPAACAGAFLLAAALGMRTMEYQDAGRRILKVFETSRAPYPVSLYLWQAGIWEQRGDLEQAMKCLIAARDARPPAPLLLAQIGLFLIRNRISDSSLFTEKKEGYAYLRMHKSLFGIVFDPLWYGNRYAVLLAASDMDSLTHYLHYGRLLALDPNPCFNQAFYLIDNRDVFFSGYDALWHFLACPSFENRNPSRLFNMQAYMARHPGIDWANANPLVHGMRQGGNAGEP